MQHGNTALLAKEQNAQLLYALELFKFAAGEYTRTEANSPVQTTALAVMHKLSPFPVP